MAILMSEGSKAYNKKVFSRFKPGMKVVYIPAWHGPEAVADYNDFKKEHPGVEVIYVSLYRKPSKEKISLLKKCDFIFLDGGNTFFLLSRLKKYHMLPLLMKHSHKLIGVSAGAIIQTPNINLAAIPRFNADENYVNLKSRESLNLVGFEVYPHYTGGQREVAELKKYSKTHNRKIYLLRDGHSLLVSGSRMRAIGRVRCLKNGKFIPCS